MKKIMFLHGFYASGQCVPATALREAFAGRVEVITPDLPMHPKEAVRFIRELIDREQPDLLITALITKTVSGVCLAKRTRLRTLNRSSCSTTTIRSTSPAVIPRRQRKSVAGMCRWPKKCWN